MVGVVLDVQRCPTMFLGFANFVSAFDFIRKISILRLETIDCDTKQKKKKQYSIVHHVITRHRVRVTINNIRR